MKKDIIEERRCKRCGQLQTYVKIKTKERICKICGYSEKIGEN